ncbi:MAG: ABC transporter ATP-binding protein [Oscillospiraceae bacterium]|nr:ABC transporter ATP-binding protein [Oscillospiraceae bacterium]
MEEKITAKNVWSKITDGKSLKWVAAKAKSQLGNIITLTLLNVLLSGVAVANSYMLRFVINSATGQGFFGTEVSARLQGITLFGIIFAVLIITRCLVAIWTNHLVFKISARLTITVKTDLYSRILRKDYSKITAYHTGEMLNRLNTDVEHVTGAITSILPGLVFMLSKLIGILVVLFTIDPVFTLIFLGVGIFVFCSSLIFRRVLKSYHKQIMETDGKIRSFMQETLQSLLVVKVFRAEDKVVENSKELQEDNYKRKRKRNFFSLTTQTCFSLAFNAAYLFGLFFCGYKIAVGDPFITYGVLSQVLSLTTQISQPIQSLTSILPTYYAAIASAERIIELEELEDEPKLISGDLDYTEIYDNLESIEFKDITFSYDRELIFEDTSLTVNKGDMILMTGISGIGKSTLSKLLLGVFPLEKGEIYLSLKDGTKHIVDSNMRPLFSYVPQGNFILSGTLRQNITFVRSDADESQIEEALRLSCADFIYDLPQGLETVIGEKGMGLSEGQVQRIAIARAFLNDSPILLLDEATSALDEETELQLLNNIKSLKNKTCILISHKKAANQICNKEVRIIDRKITVIENHE